MPRIPAALLLLLPLLLLPPLTACGSDHDADDAAGDAAAAIAVEDVWSRATPDVATTGVIYARITNPGPDDARIVSASVPATVAAKVTLHSTTMDTGGGHDGDMAEMGMMEESGIDLPAGETVALEPGGLHLMLEGLAAPLQAGQAFEVVLHFDRAPDRAVTVEVREL